MKTTNKKGFTLIELLIVIAIIGILAVAFLPTLLGAPSKGRDASRIADIQKIQKVLIDNDLAGNAYPAITGAINPDVIAYVSGTLWRTQFQVEFGGQIPVDPQTSNAGESMTGGYYHYVSPTDADPYSFVLVSHMENFENANNDCADALTGTVSDPDENTPDTWCYAVFTQ